MSPHARRALAGRERGFTLVELLVVVIIVGVLAAVAVPVFLNQRKKAVDASLKADLRALIHAQETYMVDHPDVAGFETFAAVVASGYKPSRGNLAYVGYHPSKGYCIGLHSDVSTNGVTWIFYDSALGKMLYDGVHAPTAGAVQPGGVACASGLVSLGYVTYWGNAPYVPGP